MPDRHLRHPLKNFFIKRAMQQRIVVRVVSAVVIASILSTTALMFVYSQKTAHGKLYFMYLSDNPDVPASSYGAKGMAEVVLPSFIAAQIISILVGLGIGLVSSRTIAVPIYKLEQWINHLKNGEFNTSITFRENEEMKELVQECNALSKQYNDLFVEIKKSIDAVGNETRLDPKTKEAIHQIQCKLNELKLDHNG